MKIAIILTGTVKVGVKGGHFTEKERYAMYTSTLEYYASTIGKDHPIIFVENSDADLSEWNEKFKDSLDLTVMQFRPGTRDFEGFDCSRGKGYNEYLMIKKGLQRLPEIDTEGNITHFLKITGRYAMVNIKKIIKEIEHRILKRDIVFLGDIKDTKVYDIMGRNSLAGHWGDSRFFMAEIEFYNTNMSDCYKEMYDYEWGKWAEDYFLQFSRINRENPRLKFRFRTQVLFNGVSGDTFQTRHDGLVARSRAMIRQLLRYLFPNIWF